MNRSLRSMGGLVVAVSAAMALAAPAALASTRPVGAQLAEVRVATAAYHDVNAAIAAGFEPSGPCVAGPDGAMGYHYVNMARMFDGRVDPVEPEVLLDVPQADGTHRPVGVEYISFTPTSLFGQEFEPSFGGSFALHVWVWQANPAGTFAGTNPNLAC